MSPECAHRLIPCCFRSSLFSERDFAGRNTGSTVVAFGHSDFVRESPVIPVYVLDERSSVRGVATVTVAVLGDEIAAT
jgi:hypothetical protein